MTREIHAGIVKAFNEDRAMITAQQQNLALDPDFHDDAVERRCGAVAVPLRRGSVHQEGACGNLMTPLTCAWRKLRVSRTSTHVRGDRECRHEHSRRAFVSTPTLGSQPDFSLVLGGPLFQMYRRTHLSGDALELLHRRMIVFAVVAWLPLLALSALRGDAFGNAVPMTFHRRHRNAVRFLIALPMLIAAEIVVHRRIHFAVNQFVERGIVPPEQMPKFRDAIDLTLRLRNSPIIELALVALVYTLGLWIWRTEVALDVTSWYASHDGSQAPTHARRDIGTCSSACRSSSSCWCVGTFAFSSGSGFCFVCRGCGFATDCKPRGPGRRSWLSGCHHQCLRAGSARSGRHCWRA